MYIAQNIKTFSCFNKYIHIPIKVYPKKNIKASFLHIARGKNNKNLCLDIANSEFTICKYCKGTGQILCLFCKKLDTEQNKCNKCFCGKIICWVCDGSGKYF